MIGQTISHYRIIEKLGEGGMGVVYLAEDTHLARRVAIKFLSSLDHHYRARFLREARAVSALSHANIAAVYDYGETAEGQPYLVMELVKGQTLGQLLQAESLTLKRSVEIVSSIAEALGEAHHQGIVHRDVKPSNVVITERDQVKVLDFGLVKQIFGSASMETDPSAQTLFSTHTRSDVIVGTPLYLSPEQATGKPVDGRSDLFALGALLYECIAGCAAFSGSSVIEIGAQVIHVNPSPPSKVNPRVPPELDRVTMKALEKKVESRYQSAADMLEDLRAVLATFSADRHRTPRLSPRLTAPSRAISPSALTTISESFRKPRLSLRAFLIVILVVALGVWAGIRWSQPKAYKASSLAEDWYNKGTDALRSGAYYQAAKAFEHAIDVDNRFALAHARLAEAWLELDYSDRASTELLRASQAIPDRSLLSPVDAIYFDAIKAVATRDYARAINDYKNLIQQMPAQSGLYVDLGRVYEKNEQPEEALKSYLEATSRAPQNAVAFLRIGELYGRRQDLASAAVTFDKAESLYQALGHTEGRGEVLYQRGVMFNKLNKLADARTQLEQALDVAKATPNEYLRIRALLQLSSVSYTQGVMDRAQQYANEAIDAAQASGMENLIATGLVDLGNVFFLRGEYEEAEKHFQQALTFAQRFKARRSEARAALSLGSLRIQQFRDLDRALAYIDQALKFFQQGAYGKEVSLALALRARANVQKGNFDEAFKALEQLLQLAKQIGDPSGLARAHMEIGLLLSQREQYAVAASHFQENYLINKSLGAEQQVGYSLTNRGNSFWRLGRYSEARAAFTEAEAIAAKPDAGYKGLVAWLHLTRAQMALSERRFDDAITESQEVLRIAGTQYNENAVQAKSTLGLAKLYSVSRREGKELCRQALQTTSVSPGPALVAGTQLTTAEALFENGDAEGASRYALQAAEFFERSGQQDSWWRALLIASRASRFKNDLESASEYASRAARVLGALQQTWGTENYNSYLNRPDIQEYRKQLEAVSASR